METIELVNDGTGLGFGIVGGKTSGVIVKTILPGGIADQVAETASLALALALALLLPPVGGPGSARQCAEEDDDEEGFKLLLWPCQDGRLRSGDHILRIGDTDLLGMGSEQVAQVLRQCGNRVKLVVTRGPVDESSSSSAVMPVVLPTVSEQQVKRETPPLGGCGSLLNHLHRRAARKRRWTASM